MYPQVGRLGVLHYMNIITDQSDLSEQVSVSLSFSVLQPPLETAVFSKVRETHTTFQMNPPPPHTHTSGWE